MPRLRAAAGTEVACADTARQSIELAVCPRRLLRVKSRKGEPVTIWLTGGAVWPAAVCHPPGDALLSKAMLATVANGKGIPAFIAPFAAPSAR